MVNGTTQKLWTEEEHRAVASLLLDGKSASKIGEAVGRSRNAVIGFCHRNADLRSLLSKPEAAVRRYFHPPGAKVKTAPPPKPPKSAMQPAAPVAPPVSWRSTQPAPQPRHLKPIGKLEAQECRWPVLWHAKAIGGFLCCGRDVDGERVYCAEHCRIAYRPREAAHG